MPGILRCQNVNLNDPVVVRRVINALGDLAAQSKHSLEVRGTYHFAIPSGPITTVAGWYVICDESGEPLYVGTAENVDARLNSEPGSRDGFANPKRTSDPVRNFIKSFFKNGVLPSLSVITLSEPALCARIGIKAPLPKRDRENVEKVIDVFRTRILAQSRSVRANIALEPSAPART